MDCVYESAMAPRSAVSLVHAAWSTRRTILGTRTAAKKAITASTPMSSIREKPPPWRAIASWLAGEAFQFMGSRRVAGSSLDSFYVAHQRQDRQVDRQGDGADDENQRQHQRRLQVAGRLAHDHHAQQHGRKDRLPAQSFADRAARLDVFVHSGHGVFHHQAANQALAEVERLEDRDARAVKDGEVVSEP